MYDAKITALNEKIETLSNSMNQLNIGKPKIWCLILVNGLFMSTIKTYSIVEKSTGADLLNLQQKQKESDLTLSKETVKLNKAVLERKSSDETSNKLTQDNKKLQSVINALQSGMMNRTTYNARLFKFERC